MSLNREPNPLIESNFCESVPMAQAYVKALNVEELVGVRTSASMQEIRKKSAAFPKMP